MTARTATHHRHPADYYYFLAKALISLVNRGFTHQATADALNAEGIASPTGGTFDAPKVATTLSRLRHHDKYRSLLYQGMLTLCRDGRLALADCMSLLGYLKAPAPHNANTAQPTAARPTHRKALPRRLVATRRQRAVCQRQRRNGCMSAGPWAARCT